MKITRKQLRRLIAEAINETRIKPSIPDIDNAGYEEKIRKKFIDAPYGRKEDLTQGSEIAYALDYEGLDYTRDVLDYELGDIRNRMHMPDVQRVIDIGIKNILDPIVNERLRVSLSTFKTIQNTQELLNLKASYDPSQLTTEQIHDQMLNSFAYEVLDRAGYMPQVIDSIKKEANKGLHRFSSEVPPQFRTGALQGSQTVSSSPDEITDFFNNVLSIDQSVVGLDNIIKDAFKKRYKDRFDAAIQYAEQLRAQDFQGRLI